MKKVVPLTAKKRAQLERQRSHYRWEELGSPHIKRQLLAIAESYFQQEFDAFFVRALDARRPPAAMLDREAAWIFFLGGCVAARNYQAHPPQALVKLTDQLKRKMVRRGAH